MGRLIDADILKGVFDPDTWQGETLRTAIDNSPTAYDVDKVVEQISKASDHYECEEQGREDVYMVDTEIAIDLVKGGGQG